MEIQESEYRGRDMSISQRMTRIARDSPSDPSDGTSLIDTLISDSWPPELWKNKFLLFEATKVVVIFAEVLGNEYTSLIIVKKVDFVVSGATQTQTLQRCRFLKIRGTLRGTRARQLCNSTYIHHRM